MTVLSDLQIKLKRTGLYRGRIDGRVNDELLSALDNLSAGTCAVHGIDEPVVYWNAVSRRSVTDEVFDAAVSLADYIGGVAASDILTLMALYTHGEYNTDNFSEGYRDRYGLLFSDCDADTLRVSGAAISRMSVTEQLALLKRKYRPYRGKISCGEDLFAATSVCAATATDNLDHAAYRRTRFIRLYPELDDYCPSDPTLTKADCWKAICSMAGSAWPPFMNKK